MIQRAKRENGHIRAGRDSRSEFIMLSKWSVTAKETRRGRDQAETK